ncbi:MAG: hypothetical protein ABR905_08830 [Terracidiphilus sp.]|jgi:hypothetical protein
MEKFTFEQLADFIREWSQLREYKNIAPETLFERDLGITGDDGAGLLEAVEKRFGVDLTSGEGGLQKTFNLQPNEFLFNSEGWGPSLEDLLSFFKRTPTPVVRSFTVGELYNAVEKVLKKKSENASEQSGSIAPTEPL